VALGWLKNTELSEAATRSAPVEPKAASRPLFSQRFIERTAWGIEHGELSVRRLLKLLDLGLDEFRACCQAHGMKVEIGL